MLLNHLKAAQRNLIKFKGFSLIHIGGLAIGLTAGIFIIHYARLEFGYDRFHSQSDQVYRVISSRIKDGVEITQFASTFAGAGPAMQAEYPEIESYTRLFKRFRGGIVSYGETHFREQAILHADSGFFKVFSFPLVSGSANDLLAPGYAFVEEQTARKYFGDDNPIGKRITFGSSEGLEDYEIRGVIQCPANSSLKFTFIFSYHNLGRIFGTEHLTNWTWLDFHTFIKLKENTNPADLEKRFPELLKKFRGERASNSKLSLQPLPSIYLKSKAEFETGITGDESTVRILLTLGIVIIVIVWLNFANLSTAHALTRAKEVGIRKTLGSSRLNLMIQFFVETALTNLLALPISGLLLWLLLPYFNLLTGRQLNFADFADQGLWKYLLGFFVIGTLVIGIYPALQLSSFRPVEVLKGFFVPKGQGSFLRELFVGFQALVSFSLVAAILIVVEQLKFVTDKDLVIDLHQTLVVRTPEVVTTREGYYAALNSYKSELLKNTGISQVATSADSPGEDVSWIGGTRRLGAEILESQSFYRLVIDEDFIKAFDLKITAGQNFRANQSTFDVLLNQTGVKALGFENEEASIGERLILGNDTCTVVGIVQDFHQVSPREPIVPTVFHYNRETPRLFFIKFNAAETEDVVKLAQSTFGNLFPNEPFDYYFLDEFFDRQYQQERKLATIITVFCILAVAVSSLGLLGLTWFRVSNQKKELAIRKVIGSTSGQLFYNASERLLKTTLTGCFVGMPVTWYIMQQWLQGFTVHTHPQIWQFGTALACSLLVAFGTISGYTLKVIRSNPVQHLRQN
jgi:putative ABC transport system permease protein